MTPVVFVATALAGGLGAGLRFVVDSLVRDRLGPAFPWGTFLINVTGACALGFVTELALADVVADPVRLIIGTGLLGGYTTFSTASVETVRLIQQGRTAAGLGNGLGMLVAAVAAATAGFWLAQFLA